MMLMTIHRNLPRFYTMLEQDYNIRRLLRQYAPHVSIARQSELVEFGGEFVMPDFASCDALMIELERYAVDSYWVRMDKDL